MVPGLSGGTAAVLNKSNVRAGPIQPATGTLNEAELAQHAVCSRNWSAILRCAVRGDRLSGGPLASAAAPPDRRSGVADAVRGLQFLRRSPQQCPIPPPPSPL